LPHCVDIVARNNGSQVAVKDGLGYTLTYEQMMKRTNAIAGALLAANILQGLEPRVAIFQEPTVDWVCSVLAIMRLGATYVPLDLRAPLPRLASIIKDCRPRAILSHGATIDQVPALEFDIAASINVSLLDSSNIELSNSAKPDSPAVILYTSGSTGTPKGISLHHRALRNQMEGFTKRWGITSDTILQQSAFSFDISLWEMFAALTNAGTVFIVPKVSRGDPVALSKLIADEKITVTIGVTSEYITWLRYGDIKLLQSSSWRLMLCGGEPFSDRLIQELRALGKFDLRAINVYGPTEVTVSSNEFEVPYNKAGNPESLIPVGLTAPNYSIYIVDEKLNAVPAGVPGEILIGGPSIASGYVNDETLTSQRFIPNKFASSNWISNGWTTMHRTGDRGRLRKEDGALMFEGRIVGDTQIKLRGLRIELRDVESTILATSDGALEDAVVSVRGNPQFLVAHVVFSAEYRATGDDRERFLARLLSSLPLPQYMCPAMAIPLQSMPLNNHYKKDRRAINVLALPERSRGQDLETVNGFSYTEAKLKDLWEAVLTEDIAASYKIREDSDFFHSGGNSMLLMALQSKVNQQFGISLSLIQLFEASTLRRMATCIESGSIQKIASVKIDWEQETELSPSTLTAQSYQEKIHSHELKVVVLTGSTGFLGKAILRQLVENDSVQKIHCVAVRGERRLSAFTSKKIIIHPGDLTLPRLGLSLEDSEVIFQEADTIIHNGADVSFLKTYPTLRAANLTSTMELVNLCLRGAQSRFHYISSAGVAQLTGKEVVDETSVATYLPPSDGSNGYSASKWASERYLEKVNQHLGLPIWIHRPSSIVGDDAPELDIMHNLLQYSRKMKAVPDLSSWKGWFDFISVDNVASGVIDEILSSTSLEKGTMKYVHQSGEMEVPVAEFKGFLEMEGRDKFETLSGHDWVSRAKDLGLHELVAAYVSHQGTANQPIVLPRMSRSRGKETNSS
jgi:hybrid polyketide synthase/nonribosomal peptide synthetase ACE1